MYLHFSERSALGNTDMSWAQDLHAGTGRIRAEPLVKSICSQNFTSEPRRLSIIREVEPDSVFLRLRIIKVS